MLIAIYRCSGFDALQKLLGHLDPGEQMSVDSVNDVYVVTYKSKILHRVATEKLPSGVDLLFQQRI